jgi:hypothetical protein
LLTRTDTTNLVPNPDELTTNQTFAAEQLNMYNTRRQGAYTITYGGGNVVVSLPLPNVTSDYASVVELG